MPNEVFVSATYFMSNPPSLGEVAVTGFADTDIYYISYIKPTCSVSAPDTLRTGLTEEFLSDKPPLAEIYFYLEQYIKGRAVILPDKVTENYIDAALSAAELPKISTIAKSVDTLDRIAHRRHPDADNSIKALVKRYFIDTRGPSFPGQAAIVQTMSELVRRMGETKIARAMAQQDQSESITTCSLAHFIEETTRGQRCFYRGMSDKDYLLWPSLFRNRSNKNTARDLQAMLMNDFKSKASGKLEKIPRTEIEWLVLAQHHGLPTRLLDWSENPLVAAYFAVESRSATDGAVFSLRLDRVVSENSVHSDNKPQTDIVGFLPSHVSGRVSAQLGVFTYHPDSKPSLDPSGLKKFIIPSGDKEKFLADLERVGVHKATLFPDLDGLSAHLRAKHGY